MSIDLALILVNAMRVAHAWVAHFESFRRPAAVVPRSG
jgi:hypothetical protein